MRDSDLKTLFTDLRKAESRSIPSFDRMIAKVPGLAARRRARSVRFRLITAAVSCGVVIVAALTIGVRDQTEDSDLGPILFAETSTSVLANLVLPPACPDTEAFAQIVDTEWSSPTGFFLDLEPEEPESESG